MNSSSQRFFQRCDLVIVQICVGSACHIKDSGDIVELMQGEITKNHLEGSITLAGSFCTGRCNREGVTITVDDNIYTGITKENFKEFFKEKIMKNLEKDGI